MSSEDKGDNLEPVVSSGGDSDGELKVTLDVTLNDKNADQPAPGADDEALHDGDTGPGDDDINSSDRNPEASPSAVRPTSSGSGDLTFESKRKKKKPSTPVEGHIVVFTVTISLAIPTMDDDDQPDIAEVMKKRRRVFEAPKAQNYYHLEYYLVPEDGDIIKTDLVTYGLAAKVYMERHDPRVIKTWQDGDVTWVSWAHSHTITVTNDLLLKMFNHTLELRIWDTKDKVSTRARFDRPKAFRLPPSKPGDETEGVGGVRGVVGKQVKSFTKLQPQKGPPIRPLPSQVTFPKQSHLARSKISEENNAVANMSKDNIGKTSPDPNLAAEKSNPSQTNRITTPTPHVLVSVPNKTSGDEAHPGRTYSRLGRLAGVDSSTVQEPVEGRQTQVKNQRSQSQMTGTGSKPHSRADNATSPTHEHHLIPTPPQSPSASSTMIGQSNTGVSPSRIHRNKKSESTTQAAADLIKKSGICVVPIRLAVLFAGVKTITNRLVDPVQGVEDAFITVALDNPLMSEEQRQTLNPMVINIRSVTNMPDTPMSYDELAQRCQPTYCKYSFFKQQMTHVSSGKEQARHIYWDDVNVILTGTLEPSEFRQFLNGPPLPIEIHDRDRKPEAVKVKATLFGDDLEDEKISNVGTVTSKRTLHNPFRDRNQPWDPYGVGYLDLSELLLGHKYLHLKIPIHNCTPPDPLGLQERQDGKLVGIAGAVDGPVDRPLPSGHYLDSNSMMKIKIDIAYPLLSPDQLAAKQDMDSTFECPFSRIVFRFEYKNTVMLSKIQELVTTINAEALEMDNLPKHVIEAALSTYKLAIEQQQSRDLDVITGFQILDGKIHVFVLEGLRDKAISRVWEALPQPENEDVEILFHSDLSFSERLYGPLDVDLCRIKLHEPLSVIVQQPLLYVRDMVPKPCFEALVKLEELSKAKKIKDAVRSDLFPTSDMVISMSREFGVPLTTADFEDLQPDIYKAKPEPEMELMSKPGAPAQTSRVWTPLELSNDQYLEELQLREKARTSYDFLRGNIQEVKAKSANNRVSHEKERPLMVMADVSPAHNYSSQSLNSTELAKEKLRQQMAEIPDARYSYCQDYHHSMTLTPVNVEALKKQEAIDSKAAWKTEKGWTYPGMKTLLECNVHPMDPNTARVMELRQPWEENLLHVNMLQSTLNRGNFPWNKRRLDMELYRRPIPVFGKEPVSIISSGETAKLEKMESLLRIKEDWKSKVVVANTRQYFHRCLPETEGRSKGFYSSNQIDRLRGLLKDSPTKYSVRQPGFTLTDIPPLNVVLNQSVDTASRLAGIPMMPVDDTESNNKGYKPGPYFEHSWSLERNKVPAYDYEHQKYGLTKGQDFNVYHRNRNSLWKRSIRPLTEGDMDNHLFRNPSEVDRFGRLPVIEWGQLPGSRQATENANNTHLQTSEFTEVPNALKSNISLEALVN